MSVNYSLLFVSYCGGLDNAVLGCPGSWLSLAACPGPANVSGEQKELQLFLKKARGILKPDTRKERVICFYSFRAP